MVWEWSGQLFNPPRASESNKVFPSTNKHMSGQQDADTCLQ